MSPLMNALKIGHQTIFGVDETVLKTGINHLAIDRFFKKFGSKIAS